jgi:hypothetical protein
MEQSTPNADWGRELYLRRAFENVPNTAALNLTCGISEGLPVGSCLSPSITMNRRIYQAVSAFDAVHDWKKI